MLCKTGCTEYVQLNILCAPLHNTQAGGEALSTNNNVHKIDCIQEINVLKAASNAGEVWCALVLVSTY